MFQRACGAFFLHADIHTGNILEEHEEAFAVREAISARTPWRVLSSSVSQLPVLPPSMSAVQWEFGRVKQDLFGWRLELAGIIFPWILGDCSNLNACTRMSSKGDDPSLHGRTTYTEPSQETNRAYF